MPRRQENSRMKSSFVTSRDHRNDLGRDPYLTSHSGARKEWSSRSRQSLSPQHSVDGTRMVMPGDRRSNSLERRRWYEQHTRVRGHHVMSRSPSIDRAQRKPLRDERDFNMSPRAIEIRWKHEHPEYRDYNNIDQGYKHRYSCGDHFEIEKRKDYSERSGASRCDSLVHQEMEREVRRANYGFASRYEEAGGSYSTVDMHRFKEANIQYQDAVPHEMYLKDMYYKDGEKFAYHSRDSPCIESDFRTDDIQKDIPSTSLGITAKGKYLSKFQDVCILPSNGYPKSYGKVIDPSVSGDYGQRTYSDATRGCEAGLMDAKCYACDTYTSPRAEHKDYFYPEDGFGLNDDPGYTREDGLYGTMTYVPGKTYSRDISRADIIDTTVGRIAKSEGSHSSQRINENSLVRKFDIALKEMIPDNVDIGRSSGVLKKIGRYLDCACTDLELTRKVSNYPQISEFGGLAEHETGNPRLDYSSAMYAPAHFDGTRIKNPELKNNVELLRNVRGSERNKAEEPVGYDRTLKRKYRMDEDISRDDSQRIIPNKWTTPYDSDDLDHQGRWSSRTSNCVHPERASGCQQDCSYVKNEQMSGEIYHHKDTTNVGLTSYQDQSDSIREHSGKHSRSSHLKGIAKYECSHSYSHVCHSNRRSNHYKQHNLRQRNEDDNNMTVLEKDADLSEDSAGPWKSEPSESSEGFKQRVLAALLDFSKRLNENPTARKLYKEQGKAGSLFCVVCRRSASKEFLNTKALAAHAFMCQKAGSRPQHLGLHKAICVLMGWNTMPDPDSGTWAPEALPQDEAFAQKEDLILWPPVVIVHNISLLNNDHNKWKLINNEVLGDFLRAKGFTLGKMKICLGNPGDHSVILVKFLSTFSGLQEAERLHNYFLDRKHGRVDFEEAIASITKGSDLMQEGNQIDKLEDGLLYGYLGISEDLDRVGFGTKKRCAIKSKKEINDLADAPVKPQ